MPVDTAAHRPSAAPDRIARWIDRLATGLVLLGWIAGLGSVAYVVNGATQAPATVKVPVLLAAEPSAGWGNVQLELPGVEIPDGWVSGAEPTGGVNVDSRVTLAAWGSTRAEQVLARGSGLVGGIAFLAGALLLQPVLRAVAGGRPFAPGSSRRIAWSAAVVGVAGVVAPLLPQWAGLLVLARTGLDANPTFAGVVQLSFDSVWVAVLVLVVAVAFAAGERMTRDVEGLV
ncbi:hypothetical protein Cch01nite_01370 [Cellulomonas chitinilytica]|uniref:DUF2975 domain-containing protein n=1 Tax=Cellulomonas chitinilytica TaxID=398759 RepID=A0A919NXH9_9CELL|nr:hypothetical protein [Cellulomonas chitinilytica]GIG19413.1 hypothetical protein Cch01nite_01370 [Cellulomonas chitinilytica]